MDSNRNAIIFFDKNSKEVCVSPLRTWVKNLGLGFKRIHSPILGDQVFKYNVYGDYNKIINLVNNYNNWMKFNNPDKVLVIEKDNKWSNIMLLRTADGTPLKF